MKQLIFALTLLFISHTEAAIIFVDQNATGANNGSSFADAFTELSDALAVANPQDEIRVAAGTYNPGMNRGDSFQLVPGTTVLGGFNAKSGKRDCNAQNTILTGDVLNDDNQGYAGGEVVGLITSISNNGDNNYHVVMGAAQSILDGFVIQGGNADGVDNDSYGGGILNEYGNDGFTVRCSVIRFNAANHGAGLYNWSSNIRISKTVFDRNLALYTGGAIHFRTSPMSFVSNSVFHRNNATFAQSLGGAIANASSAPIIWNSTFYGNWADAGGAVANRDSEGTLIVNSILYGDGDRSESGTAEIYNSVGQSTVVYSDVFLVGTAVYPGAGNINEFPLYTAPDAPPFFGAGLDNLWATGDDGLQVNPGSPVIDVGTIGYACGPITLCLSPTTDILNQVRWTVGEPFIDMGAYEAEGIDIGGGKE